MPVALLAALIVAAPGLEAKVESVLPTPAEDKWLEVPWRTNVLRAAAEAQEQNKPLFIWVMNGNPIGGT